MFATKTSRFSGRLACVLGLVFMVGCGARGDLQGTVKYRPVGKSLVTGTVMVMGADNQPRYGMIETDGKYLVRDVPIGPAKVTVSSPNPAGTGPVRTADGRAPSKMRGMEGENTAAPPPVSEEIKKGWFEIPEKYNSPTSSGLSFDIKKGANTYDIVLD
jgi:hypothetical protein